MLSVCLAHTDEDGSTWLGQSWFGSQWRRLINYNQFFSAATLNGGLLGGFASCCCGGLGTGQVHNRHDQLLCRESYCQFPLEGAS